MNTRRRVKGTKPSSGLDQLVHAQLMLEKSQAVLEACMSENRRQSARYRRQTLMLRREATRCFHRIDSLLSDLLLVLSQVFRGSC